MGNDLIPRHQNLANFGMLRSQFYDISDIKNGAIDE
jgi:hypothetical protein